MTCSYFGRNDDFINSFWDLLTFRWIVLFHKLSILFKLLLNKDTTTQDIYTMTVTKPKNGGKIINVRPWDPQQVPI